MSAGITGLILTRSWSSFQYKGHQKKDNRMCYCEVYGYFMFGYWDCEVVRSCHINLDLFVDSLWIKDFLLLFLLACLCWSLPYGLVRTPIAPVSLHCMCMCWFSHSCMHAPSALVCHNKPSALFHASLQVAFLCRFSNAALTLELLRTPLTFQTSLN